MMSRLADLAVSTTFAGSLLLANTSCATRGLLVFSAISDGTQS